MLGEGYKCLIQTSQAEGWQISLSLYYLSRLGCMYAGMDM